MNHETFMRFCAEKVQRGEKLLAALSRTLIQRDEPELYEHLADLDDAVFLEPLLFARFAAQEPVVPIPQLLFGALATEARPDAIDVRTDDAGRLYLPRVGYFHTIEPRREMVLEWDRERDEYLLRGADGRPVQFRFEGPLFAEDTTIEIARYQHALLAPLFLDRDGHHRAVSVDDAAAAHASQLGRACAILREHEPLLHAGVARTTRCFVPFRGPMVNSFATLGAHGMAFFAASERDDEVFFLDDIAHQCGHVVFNAMTVQHDHVLTIDAETRVGTLTGGAEDNRPVYGALHGLFTEYMMCRALAQAEAADVFDGRAAHELTGRFAFIATKYGQDIVNLDHDIYTDEGRYCFEALRQAGADLKASRPDLWAYDMANQPYAFDYAIFAAQNPR